MLYYACACVKRICNSREKINIQWFYAQFSTWEAGKWAFVREDTFLSRLGNTFSTVPSIDGHFLDDKARPALNFEMTDKKNRSAGGPQNHVRDKIMILCGTIKARGKWIHYSNRDSARVSLRQNWTQWNEMRRRGGDRKWSFRGISKNYKWVMPGCSETSTSNR